MTYPITLSSSFRLRVFASSASRLACRAAASCSINLPPRGSRFDGDSRRGGVSGGADVSENIRPIVDKGRCNVRSTLFAIPSSSESALLEELLPMNGIGKRATGCCTPFSRSCGSTGGAWGLGGRAGGDGGGGGARSAMAATELSTCFSNSSAVMVREDWSRVSMNWIAPICMSLVSPRAQDGDWLPKMKDSSLLRRSTCRDF